MLVGILLSERNHISREFNYIAVLLLFIFNLFYTFIQNHYIYYYIDENINENITATSHSSLTQLSHLAVVYN